jgi:hypothetical protein
MSHREISMMLMAEEAARLLGGYPRAMQWNDEGMNASAHSENLKSLSELFEPEPTRWGLRGDAWLWSALQERYAAPALPESLHDLIEVLDVALRAEIGIDLRTEEQELIYVDRFAHGGMSSGCVSLPWWREIGIPMLTSRWQAMR